MIFMNLLLLIGHNPGLNLIIAFVDLRATHVVSVATEIRIIRISLRELAASP